MTIAKLSTLSVCFSHQVGLEMLLCYHTFSGSTGKGSIGKRRECSSIEWIIRCTSLRFVDFWIALIVDIVPVEVFEEQCEENNEKRNYDQKEQKIAVRKAEIAKWKKWVSVVSSESLGFNDLILVRIWCSSAIPEHKPKRALVLTRLFFLRPANLLCWHCSTFLRRIYSLFQVN